MKLERFRFTDIQRLEILDCLPKNSPERDLYVEDLEYHLNGPFRMREAWAATTPTGRKKDLAKRMDQKLQSLEDAVAEYRIAFEELSAAHSQESGSPTIPTQIGEEIGKMLTGIRELAKWGEIMAPYKYSDAREKRQYKEIVATTLSLWCRHFPDATLPRDPRQGRYAGPKEPSRPFRLCGIAVEAVTGDREPGLLKIYKEIVNNLTVCVPLYAAAAEEKRRNEHFRKTLKQIFG